MKTALIALILSLVIAGCGKKEESGSASPAQRGMSSEKAVSRYLAYQHQISIDTEARKVSAIFEAAQLICREATADHCEILESRLSTGRTAHASLKFRAKPSGIRKLITALGKQAEVTEQSTTAEDLASPITDAAQKLEMLKDYRSKLEALRDRAGNDIDSLIKVNKELAQVQSELEAVTGNHAHLMQRVETEILNVSIHSVQNQAFWRPITLAITDFGGNFSQGISIAITGIAYLIPWGLFVLFVVWAGRRLWLRWKGVRASA